MKQIFKALDMIRQCDNRAFWLRIVYVVIMHVLPLVNLYVLKFLIDAVSNGEPSVLLGVEMNTWVSLGLFSFIFLLDRIVAVLNSVNNDIMQQRLIDYISERMQAQSARLDMSYFDNPEYHDTYHRAQQEASYRPIQILNGFMGLLGSLISITVIMVMLTSVSYSGMSSRLTHMASESSSFCMRMVSSPSSSAVNPAIIESLNGHGCEPK